MQEIEKLLEERGAVYGDFNLGTLTEAVILQALKDHYFDTHHVALAMKHQVWFSKFVTKLVRLSASPNHYDSYQDLVGYGTLIMKTLEKTE